MKEEFPIKITGKAYLLRPDLPPEGIKRPEGGGELREPMRTNAIESGLPRMKRPGVVSYTIPALEATEYAKEQGKFDEFHKACYRALWEDGLDLGNMDVIEGIARACDLNWQELDDRLRSNHYREEVMSQYVEGRQIGFQGIPGFVIGNAGFTGAAPYDVFRSAAQRAMTLMSGATASEGEG